MDTISNSTTKHGVFMNIHGVGTLLTGKSGSGKSELALSLINNGHQLIADDAPIFYQESEGSISGKCPELLQDYLQVKNLGILNIRAMFGDCVICKQQKLELIIALQENENIASYFPEISHSQQILGVKIPEINISNKSQHITILTECAVRNYRLIKAGYYANDEFAKKQQQVLL